MSGKDPNSNRRTPLHYAAAAGSIEEVKRLLAEGAEVDQADVFGWTPLHFAVVFGTPELIPVLAEAGADVNRADNMGRTPLFLALGFGLNPRLFPSPPSSSKDMSNMQQTAILDPLQIFELCQFAYVADREARSDLARGYIRNEDDYTSNFTSGIRRIVNSNSKTGLEATSYLLPVSEERRLGCDATIIVTGHGGSKIILFEAKLPGLAVGKRSWDYSQTSSGISHFSDQLERQKKSVPQMAVFEMFYCDFEFGNQPPFMRNETSSCVWHLDAVDYDSQRRSPGAVWGKKDLEEMLKGSGIGVDEVIRSACQCETGKPVNLGGSIDTIGREFGIEGILLHIKDRNSEF